MPNTHEHWKAVVDRHFVDHGIMQLGVVSSKPDSSSKDFIVGQASISRFFHILFNRHVESLQISVNGAVETPLGSDTAVTCERARFIFVYNPDRTRNCPIEVSLTRTSRVVLG
jgi:hypothetical protein